MDSGEYDKYVKYYYSNILNSLKLYTYNEEKLEKMTPILIDPILELYEELDYAFTHSLFETVFRNNYINIEFKQDLLSFKRKVDNIPNEIWDWQFLDKHETWIEIRKDADELLNKLGIKSREYDLDFTTIILNTGEIVKPIIKK